MTEPDQSRVSKVYKSYEEFRARYYVTDELTKEAQDTAASFGKSLAKRVLKKATSSSEIVENRVPQSDSRDETHSSSSE